MSSNLSVPDTGSSGPSGRSDESEGYRSISDDLRRLRTGKRGRPPIDPAQNGLVERRRNQVRKAQRAYRTRKETEAAFRINYVQDLEGRISRMRQSFFELMSHVTKADIARRQPDLTHQLQSIARDFLSASQVPEPFNESQRDDGPTHYNHLWDDPGSSTPVVFSNIDTSCTTELPVPATVPIEMLMPTLGLPLGFPSTLSGTEVPVPRNFAQRLYLNCIKRAHGLLINPCADRTEVSRVFQYSFHYSDASTMILTLDTLLQSNADYQTAYVYRLGGAGTHYKNRQTELGIVQNVPFRQLTLSEDNSDTWFDPRDIEGWLEEHGLVIGGAQSFMYLSDFCSFEPRRGMILYAETEPSQFSERNIQQSAKILNVDRFIEGLSCLMLIRMESVMRQKMLKIRLEQNFFRGECVWAAHQDSVAWTLKRHSASRYQMIRLSFANSNVTVTIGTLYLGYVLEHSIGNSTVQFTIYIHRPTSPLYIVEIGLSPQGDGQPVFNSSPLKWI
ncbi:hypothetical protein PENFLA_c001G03670 [Penicillium flavigenum]|uniref:BZIP domain-containing protein n=1 Tax=Penicillium flavigenum TaxID=254877 RepID=A0A1V6U340_9EURO|nr:hypothetical protein PENFLA_c001G03670 [Penicillium flavigenum]